MDWPGVCSGHHEKGVVGLKFFLTRLSVSNCFPKPSVVKMLKAKTSFFSNLMQKSNQQFLPPPKCTPWSDSSCLMCFMSSHSATYSLHSFALSTSSVFSTSCPISMRCWGMSNRHGNPFPGQFSSWEEEEGGDHCCDQGLISAQWHQREGGGLQHHLKRYAPAPSVTVVHANISSGTHPFFERLVH